MCPTDQPNNKPVYRVYDGIEFEVLPLSNFVSSPLVSTTSELLASMITPEDEDHEERVVNAKYARSRVTTPFKPYRGETNPQALLNAAIVVAIRKAAEAGVSHNQLAATYNVTRSCIGHIVYRRTWKHVA